MSAASLQASRMPKKTPRPVASVRPRTPPWATGLPVTQPRLFTSSAASAW